MTMSDRAHRRQVRFSRRTLLKGAGVAMALPWLESIPAFGSDIGAAGAVASSTTSGVIPKRMAILFMANGVNSDHYTAKGDGADMVLGKTLAPMEKYKSKMN